MKTGSSSYVSLLAAAFLPSVAVVIVLPSLVPTEHCVHTHKKNLLMKLREGGHAHFVHLC